MMSIDKLSFPKIGAGCKEISYSQELLLEQWIVPAETKVKIYQSENFGWVVLFPGALDKRGI